MRNSAGGLRRTIAVLLVAAAGTGLATACSTDTRDRMCMSDEYPVAVAGYAGSGECIADGEQPPQDDVRYPKGQVPQHVGDRWDRYWQNHALDADGRLITDPDKVRK